LQLGSSQNPSWLNWRRNFVKLGSRTARPQNFSTNDIVKFWHDQCGLSLDEAIVLRDHISHQAFYGYVSPDIVELLKRLFPEVRQQQKAFTDEIAERMDRWGFDTKQLSVITGNLYPATLTPRHGFLRLNEDPTVAQALGQTIRNASTDPPGATSQLPSDKYWQDIGSPHLLSLDTTIKGKQTADIVFEYEVPIEMLVHPSSSGGRFGGSISEIVTVLDPATQASEVDVDLTLPTGIHPVISPSPDSVHELKNGKRSFRLHLKASRQNVHIKLLDFQTPDGASAYLSQFPRNKAEIETNLKLSGSIKNLTVQPLLQAVRYTQLRQFDAHKHLLEMRQTHPNFGGFDAITNQDKYLTLEAKQLYQWIEAKGQSPLFDGEKDFDLLESLFRQDLLAANESAVAELARHVEALSDKELSPKQRMGRSLVLCQRGVEPQKNLAHLLQLAKSNDELTMHGLRLIQAMTVEKASALPFVRQQIADAKRKKLAIPTSNPKWRKLHGKYNAGYHALRTFRSPQAASQLIAFIAKGNDSLIIQGAVDSLGTMTLPHLFDDLIKISGPVAASSHSGFYKYLELLIRSQPKRAIVVLGSMRKKHPQFATRITVLLADHGDRLQLPAAIETYNTSKNKEQLSAAVQSLKFFDDPNVIKQLKFRTGLDKWANESVLSLLRGRNGQRHAYPFIESFYHEFVKGKKANHHSYCVTAFEAAGDQRAIPHLMEILKTTERKDDAAHAIGNLMHDRRIYRSPRRLEYKLAGFIDDVQYPATPAVERDEALKMLLQTPEASMKGMLKRGRIKDLLSGDSSIVWQQEDEKRLRHLSQFGDTAVKHLLDASRECSLSARYQLKHLFKMAQAGSRVALRESAGNKSADIDQRRTAILTLGAMRDEKSVTVLANLLEDKLLRGNAIDALASIGTPDARQALRDLKGQLVSDEHDSVLRRNAWNAKLENAGLE
jgi:HEAT repeat protein